MQYKYFALGVKVTFFSSMFFVLYIFEMSGGLGVHVGCAYTLSIERLYNI